MEILKMPVFGPKIAKVGDTDIYVHTMMQHLITTKKYTTSEFLLEAAKS